MAFRHDDAVLMNRVAGVRADHHVARADHRKQKMRERVLRSDGDDGFFFRRSSSTL